MQSYSFLEFLARQGHRIIETESSYWYDAQKGFYFYFPYHRLITPDKEEIQLLLLREHCLGVRYFTSMDHIGKESYMIVCTDKNYDFESLDPHSARRETRKGLENVAIRQMEICELAARVSELYQDTLIRQGRTPFRQAEKKWKLYCSSAEGLEGFEAWGAFTGNNPAAFMMTYQMEDHFTILLQSSATKYLALYPNNALVFSVTKLKLASPDVNAVYYGPQSLDAPESLDKFKFRMGFQKRPIKQAIVFNPVIRPFINGFMQKSIHLISSILPKSDTFRKIEGLVRFYREST